MGQSGAVSAMLDVSDGLAGDLGHICRLSGVGARLMAETIPLSAANRALEPNDRRPALERALHGGEDYELLLALKPHLTEKLTKNYRDHFARPLIHIGEIITGDEIILSDEEGERPLAAAAFDHFKVKPEKPR